MFPDDKRIRRPRRRESTRPAPMQRARRFLLPLKLSVEGSALDVFFFSKKKYRPPRPMGVKGGCSPQNNLPKSGRYYPSLNGAATKIYINYTAPFRKPFASPVRMLILTVIPTIWDAKNFQPLAKGCDARFNFT